MYYKNVRSENSFGTAYLELCPDLVGNRLELIQDSRSDFRSARDVSVGKGWPEHAKKNSKLFYLNDPQTL